MTFSNNIKSDYEVFVYCGNSSTNFTGTCSYSGKIYTCIYDLTNITYGTYYLYYMTYCDTAYTNATITVNKLECESKYKIRYVNNSNHPQCYYCSQLSSSNYIFEINSRGYSTCASSCQLYSSGYGYGKYTESDENGTYITYCTNCSKLGNYYEEDGFCVEACSLGTVTLNYSCYLPDDDKKTSSITNHTVCSSDTTSYCVMNQTSSCNYNTITLIATCICNSGYTGLYCEKIN